VRNYLKGAGVGLSLASCLWFVNCEGTRGPANPTTGSLAAPVPAVGSGGSNAPLVLPWHCMTATVAGAWQPVDCPTSGSRSLVRLSTGGRAITAPGIPTSLTATVSGARVTLNWLGPSIGDLPTSYIVEAGSATGRADLANFDTGTTAATLVADGVAPGTYFVRVRARNSAGVSASSNEIVVSITGSGPCTPAAPTNLIASAFGSTATVQWTAPAGACSSSSYTIEAGSVSGGSNLANFNTGNAATSFVAAGVGAGTYYVRVRAANGSNTSAPSNEVTLIVGSGCSAPPPAPGGLTGSVSGTTVSLVWLAA